MADVLNRTTKQILKSVHTPDYPTASWIHNPDLSALSSVPVEYWQVSGDAVSEMDQASKDVVDAAGLSALKKSRYVEIDNLTKELINQGFEYPAASGTYFSLSLEGQSNIHGAYTSRTLPEFAYPVKWLSIDDGASVSLANASDVENFFLAALAVVRSRKDSGSDLKEQIRNAADKAAVDLIIDGR